MYALRYLRPFFLVYSFSMFMFFESMMAVWRPTSFSVSACWQRQCAFAWDLGTYYVSAWHWQLHPISHGGDGGAENVLFPTNATLKSIDSRPVSVFLV